MCLLLDLGLFSLRVALIRGPKGYSKGFAIGLNDVWGLHCEGSFECVFMGWFEDLRVPFKGPFGMDTDITVKRPRLGPVINGGRSGSHYSANTV